MGSWLEIVLFMNYDAYYLATILPLEHIHCTTHTSLYQYLKSPYLYHLTKTSKVFQYLKSVYYRTIIRLQ